MLLQAGRKREERKPHTSLEFFIKIGSKSLSIIFDGWTSVWVWLLLVVDCFVVILIKFEPV